MATKAQLLGIINTQLASNQPILASQHRTQIITMLDELYNAQSRGNVLSGLPLTSLQLANDTFLAFRDGAALQIPFSSIFDDPLTLGTPNGLQLDGTVLSLGLASATTTGALSFADFSIFNGKENAFVKNTGFNKNFGSAANTVTQGNDARLSDARVPLAHTHVIGDVIGLQTALNNKENAFAKNTGFNKNFGTVAGTVAQGNDARFHAAATLGTANGLSLAGQVLSLGLSSTSATGALSAANFNIFNEKVGGSGTTNFLSKFTGAGTIGNSAVFENGGNVGIGTTSPTNTLVLNSGTNGNFSTGLTLTNFSGTATNTGNSIQFRTSGNSLKSEIVGNRTSLNFGVLLLNAYGSTTNINSQIRIGTATGNDEQGDIRFATGNNSATERLRITSTGNVGIGTTTPSAKLDVSGDAKINGVDIGRGGGNLQNNTRVGLSALLNNTTGNNNTAIGREALLDNISGGFNAAYGYRALRSNTTGIFNTAIGHEALLGNTTGGLNTAIGVGAGKSIASNSILTIANSSIFIGDNTRAAANNQSNQIVIGNNAIGAGDNSVVLGHTTITKTVLRGTINAANLPTSSAGLSAGDIFNDNGTLKIV